LGAHARQAQAIGDDAVERAHVERLVEEDVRDRFEKRADEKIVDAAAHEDDLRHLAGEADAELFIERTAIHLRHVDIAEDNVEAIAARDLREGALTARRDGDLARRRDEARERATEELVVVDDENATCAWT